jgi:hypothetical protein
MESEREREGRTRSECVREEAPRQREGESARPH